MTVSDLFGWFGDWPIFFWIIILVGGLIFIKRRFGLMAIGKKIALLGYGLFFFTVLNYGERLGAITNAPLPSTLLLLAGFGLGYYYIWKKQGGGQKT